MTTKENFVIYKNRIKNEIASIDPSQKDEYLMIEWDYYVSNYLLNFPNSIEEMKGLLEYDRIVLIIKDEIEAEKKAKKAKEQAIYDALKNWSLAEKIAWISVFALIIGLLFKFA